LYIRDILLRNGYPIKFINELIENRRIKYNIQIITVSQSSELNLSKSFISLPYAPGLGKKLTRFLQKYKIDTCFQSVRPLSSFLNSGKNLTRGNWVIGVYSITCSCVKFYTDKTHQ
jgi:hypothetical protein